AIGLLHRTEKGVDRFRVGDVGRRDEGAVRRKVGERGGLLEHFLTAPGEHDVEPDLQEGVSAGAADAAPGPGDDGDLVWHVEAPPWVRSGKAAINHNEAVRQ